MSTIILGILLIATSPNHNVEARSNEVLKAPSDLQPDDPLLWGPYRPNLYFGVRPRLPESLLMGLMWSSGDQIEYFTQNLRHTCEQDPGISKYGWLTYEPRYGGHQEIEDLHNQLGISIDFAKFHNDELGWGARVKCQPRTVESPSRTSTLIVYVGSEATTSRFACAVNEGEISATCEGNVIDDTTFTLRVFPSINRGSFSPDRYVNTSILGMQVKSEEVWLAKNHLIYELKTSKSNILHRPGNSNLHFIQISANAAFEFDIFFSSSHSPDHHDRSTEVLSSAIESSVKSFNDNFEAVYTPQAPFHDERYRYFSKALLSNLLGGIGYFHGTSRVSSEKDAEKVALSSIDTMVVESGPFELFTAVPSRPFFPRGFLWDEGFHLQVIVAWDFDLALEILESWLNLMDNNGWIAREQILGDEARSKVPPEFQTQYQTYANPPTIFMAAEMLLAKATGKTPYRGMPSKYLSHDDSQIRSRMTQIFMNLRKHYNWFRSTQSGQTTEYDNLLKSTQTEVTEGYRWRGRTPDHILTSGLDDYPRTKELSVSELHLDALCWVSLMAKVLQKFSMFANPDDISEFYIYSNHSAAIVQTLERIHWSKKDQAYCDVVIVNGKIKHVCHKGYVSLMPLLTQPLDGTAISHDRISAMLDLIASPAHLWTQYGLRSLSQQDSYYGKGENYWRSPIWINFNYLALNTLGQLAMLSTSPHHQRARSLYVNLRKNIVNTVFESWNHTGFAWEQYNPDTGAGQRTRDFTGWTALIVRIIAMPDLGISQPGTSDSAQPRPVIPSEKGAFSFSYVFAISGVMACLVLLLRKPIRRAIAQLPIFEPIRHGDFWDPSTISSISRAAIPLHARSA